MIATTDGNGNLDAANSYDEYGIPGSGNQGRFQYTGQMWLPELGMYYYKARIYSPTLGRFLQTDPIGVAGGINLYGYVGNDPVNWTDPLGWDREPNDGCSADAWVCGTPEDPFAGIIPLSFRVVRANGADQLGFGPQFYGVGGGISDPAPTQVQKCQGLVADVMKGLYQGGGKANQVAVNAGLAAGGLAVIPGGQAAATLMGGLAGISGSVGIASELIAGGYYAYKGNWTPLGKSVVGSIISKLNPLGKNSQHAWDKVVNLDAAENTENSQCSPE